MAINAKLELRQSQQLVMTPQLQQAIKLLQLSNLELSEFVATELERNPLLERDDVSDAPVSERREASPPEPEGGDPKASDEWVGGGAGTSEAANTLDTDYENIYPDTSSSDMGGNLDSARLAGSEWAGMRSRGSGIGSGEDANLEAYLSESLSLRDHLSQQLAACALIACRTHDRPAPCRPCRRRRLPARRPRGTGR